MSPEAIKAQDAQDELTEALGVLSGLTNPDPGIHREAVRHSHIILDALLNGYRAQVR